MIPARYFVAEVCGKVLAAARTPEAAASVAFAWAEASGLVPAHMSLDVDLFSVGLADFLSARASMHPWVREAVDSLEGVAA